MKFLLLFFFLNFNLTGAQLPNIVFVLIDDMGWNDVGYHGSHIKTPNIDKLANEGIELNKFYTCPVCSPAISIWTSMRG